MIDCQIIMYAYVKTIIFSFFFFCVRVDVLAVGDIRDCAPYCDHSSRCLIRRYSGLIVQQIWFVLSNKIRVFLC
jgi:hypothetical protein